MVRRRGWAFAGLGLLLFLCSALLHAMPVVDIDPAESQRALSPFLHYRHDPTGRDDLAEARRHLQAGGFAALPEGSANFGFQSGAYWFHARIVNRNPDEPRWLLLQQFALSDRVDVYTRYPDGSTRHQLGGDSVPFGARSVRYRHPNFWIGLPANQPVDLFVRVQSESSMQVPLVLYTPSAFAEVSRDAQFGIGLYYGILLALLFYNLVLWLMLRDASYFWYGFHITAFGLVLFTLNGLGFEYLWPNWTWLADKSVPLSICLAQVGMQQFARNFLGLRQRWPFGDRVGLAMIGFFVLLGIAATRLPYHASTPLASAAVFLSIAWIAVETVVTVRKGYKPARLFLIAWSMFLLGTGMFAAIAFGLLPKTFTTEYGVQIGSALEMLLLSIALGYRYASLRNENERIVGESRQRLEQQVEQRTAELRNALGQLGDAHARLRESSQRDGLTGLHTRSHFRERVETLLDQARQHGGTLSLLMIDLDNFKQINDGYGHLVGDECLRWAARAVGHALRPHDALLARFGGEEFIVALPGLDLRAATAVAEDLRRQLSDQPCIAHEHQVAVSASIGVHQVDLQRPVSIDAALQQADEALYRAKADGRDCVRTSAPLSA